MAKTDLRQFAVFVKAVRTACRTGMGNMGETFVEDVRDHFPKRGKYDSSAPGEPPARKKNLLSDSITAAVVDDVRVVIFPAAKYGPVHEFGGTLSPTKSKYLRIPINEAAKRLSDKSGTMSLRDIGVFRIFRSRAGNLIALGQDDVRTQRYETGPDGKRKTVVDFSQPLFKLQPSVNLPARPFMRPALKRAAGSESLLGAFVDGVNLGISRTFKGIRIKKA